MTFWLLGCCRWRETPDGQIQFHAASGYRICDTEGEARTSFLAACQAANPDFAVHDMSCVEIPPAELRRAMGIEIDADAGPLLLAGLT